MGKAGERSEGSSSQQQEALILAAVAARLHTGAKFLITH